MTPEYLLAWRPCLAAAHKDAVDAETEAIPFCIVRALCATVRQAPDLGPGWLRMLLIAKDYPEYFGMKPLDCCFLPGIAPPTAAKGAQNPALQQPASTGALRLTLKCSSDREMAQWMSLIALIEPVIW